MLLGTDNHLPFKRNIWSHHSLLRDPAIMDQLPPLGAVERFDFPLPVLLSINRGMQGLLVERPDLPLVHLRFILQSGVAVDPHDQLGVAYATSQMLDEGAGKFSSLELSSELLQIGAGLSAWAEGDSTTIAMQVLRKHLDRGLQLLSDIIQRPHFSQKDWTRVKGDLFNRALQRRSRPGHVAHLVLKNSVYNKHPYAHSALPLPQHIASLQLQQLRNFHRAHYRPDNTLVIAAGAITAKEFSQMIQKHFGAWSGRPPVKRSIKWPPVTMPGPRLVLIHRENAPQSTLRVGHLGPSRDTEDYAGIKILNTIFGGSFTSRLNLNLRERHGFTYGVRSYFIMPHYEGLFGIKTSVETKDTVAALEEIFHEMQHLINKPVEKSELDKAKRLVLEDLPALAETLEGMVDVYSDLMEHQQPLNSLRELPDEINALTPSTIKTLARRYLKPQHATIVVVGDLEKIAAPLQKRYGKAKILDVDGQPIAKTTGRRKK